MNIRHTPYYCEENIWHLAQQAEFVEMKMFVVIVSNEARCCPFFYQQVSDSPEKAIWWDYHVILLCKSQFWSVWDLDSTIPSPVTFTEYYNKTFNFDTNIKASLFPLFRIVLAEKYISHFSSDRSHMRRTDGSWIAPPPEWPIIMNEDKNTFLDLTDMKNDTIGEILNFDSMYNRFSQLY